MSDVVEFLKARIAEDEAAAHAGKSSQADEGWDLKRHPAVRGVALWPHVGNIHEEVQAAHIVRWHPWRVLAECEAKRRIITEHALTGEYDLEDEDGYPTEVTVHYCSRCATGYSCSCCLWLDPSEGGRLWKLAPCTTLRALALPYSDHPDYDPAWSVE